MCDTMIECTRCGRGIDPHLPVRLIQLCPVCEQDAARAGINLEDGASADQPMTASEIHALVSESRRREWDELRQLASRILNLYTAGPLAVALRQQLPSPPFAGGQGRTAADTVQSARVLWWLLCLAIGVVVGLVAVGLVVQ